MTQHCVYCRIQVQKFPQAIIKKLQLGLQSHNLNRVTVMHHEADPANSVRQTAENKYLPRHCTLTACMSQPRPCTCGAYGAAQHGFTVRRESRRHPLEWICH